MLRLAIYLVAAAVTARAMTTVPMTSTDPSVMPTTTGVISGPTTLGLKPTQVLYDFKHHNAFLVREDGCYEYHMKHQDTLDAQSVIMRPGLEHNAFLVRDDGCYEYHMKHQDTLDAQSVIMRPVLEARLIQELSQATILTQMGSSHLDHSTNEIRAACSQLPFFRWE